jgi:hypothetical protein
MKTRSAATAIGVAAALVATGAFFLPANAAPHSGIVASHTAAKVAPRTGGTIHVWVTPKNGAVQPILLTGAIGDYGKAINTSKSGKKDNNGEYVDLHLQQGTIRVNAVAFNNKAHHEPPSLNKATCSVWATERGPVTLFGGTGAYAGISGTVHIATSFAEIGRRSSSGRCQLSGAPAAGFRGPITGSGHVSY